MALRQLHTHPITPPLSDWGDFNTPHSGAPKRTSDTDSTSTRSASPAQTPTPSTPPPGSVLRGTLDEIDIDLISITAPRHTVHRTPQHVASAPKRHIFTIMLTGESNWQPERASGTDPARLSAGQAAYWTSELPYRWEFSTPFQLLSLRVPYHVADYPAPALFPLSGHVFPTTHGFARYLIPFTEQILLDPHVLHQPTGSRIVQHLASMFTTMLAGELDELSPPDASRPAFDRLANYLATHLHEPLTLREVAAEHHMSPRYVQTLFQQRGSTFSEWVRSRRLQRAKLALADPQRAHVGIGAIGHECGFSDHGHFARAFRAQFHESPSSWRDRVLGTSQENPPA